MGKTKENRAVSSLDMYFSLLEETGYAGNATVCRYLLFLFLLEFTEDVFVYMREGDYIKIRNILEDIFSAEDCLLPYPIACEHRSVLGTPYPMNGNVRKTITQSVLRKTETENLRRV